MTICAECGQETSGVVLSSVVTRSRPRALRAGLIATGFVVLGSILLTTRAADEPAEITQPPIDGQVVDPTTEPPLDNSSAGASPGNVTDARDKLQRLGLDQTVAFQSADGLVLLDLDTGDFTVFDNDIEPIGLLANVARTEERFLLASNGDQTFAIDRNRANTIQIISSVGAAIPTNEPRMVAIISTKPADGIAGTAVVASTDADIIGVQVELPLGAQRVVAPGRGVFFISPSGGSFLLTSKGFEAVAAGRVRAATSSHWLEYRCTEELECATFLVDTMSDTEFEVRVPPSGPVALAPDGETIFFVGDQIGAVVFDVAGSWKAQIEAVGMNIEPFWAADGSFVAWTSTAGDAIRVLRRGDSATIDLDVTALGMASAVSQKLAIFNS